MLFIYFYLENISKNNILISFFAALAGIVEGEAYASKVKEGLFFILLLFMIINIIIIIK